LLPKYGRSGQPAVDSEILEGSLVLLRPLLWDPFEKVHLYPFHRIRNLVLELLTSPQLERKHDVWPEIAGADPHTDHARCLQHMSMALKDTLSGLDGTAWRAFTSRCR